MIACLHTIGRRSRAVTTIAMAGACLLLGACNENCPISTLPGSVESNTTAPAPTASVAPVEGSADHAFPSFTEALDALPKAARDEATVIFLATSYRRRGSHSFPSDGRGVWYLEQGYKVLEVYKGVLKADHVGVANRDTHLYGQDLYFVALRPTPDSEALLQDERARFTHQNALQLSEVLAVVPR